MNDFQVRTDLALEAREHIGEDSLHGIRVEEENKSDIDVHITRVVISTKNGARAMNKPMGSYITLEAPALQEEDEGYHREISKELARQIQSLIPHRDTEKSILVVGLGNRNVTADSLGPCVIDNLLVTRHIIREYGKAAYDKDKVNQISGIVPGVMAATGMEAAEIIRGVTQQIMPDLIIAVDALAARSTRRLNRTIQVTDAGIQPGSGVGNHRDALTIESMGIPVIAIGVPTVVDAATIVEDAVGQRSSMPELNNMYVTGKNIDEIVKRLSFTISEALNIALEL